MEDLIDRLFKFMEHKGLSQNQFEITCGLPHSDIRSRKQGPTASYVAKIITKFPELNLNWLVSGKGQMLVGRQETKTTKQIPLLPFSAVAGWMTDNNHPDYSFETMIVSDFSARGADCAIRVEGDSMYPRYKNGDILAIRILHDPSFFQWGRSYVLSTSQGCVVKKLFPDPTDDNNIICHSENHEHYPDYKIMKSDILGVAIVVGHAGVE